MDPHRVPGSFELVVGARAEHAARAWNRPSAEADGMDGSRYAVLAVAARQDVPSLLVLPVSERNAFERAVRAGVLPWRPVRVSPGSWEVTSASLGPAKLDFGDGYAVFSWPPQLHEPVARGMDREVESLMAVASRATSDAFIVLAKPGPIQRVFGIWDRQADDVFRSIEHAVAELACDGPRALVAGDVALRPDSVLDRALGPPIHAHHQPRTALDGMWTASLKPDHTDQLALALANLTGDPDAVTERINERLGFDVGRDLLPASTGTWGIGFSAHTPIAVFTSTQSDEVAMRLADGAPGSVFAESGAARLWMLGEPASESTDGASPLVERVLGHRSYVAAYSGAGAYLFGHRSAGWSRVANDLGQLALRFERADHGLSFWGEHEAASESCDEVLASVFSRLLEGQSSPDATQLSPAAWEQAAVRSTHEGSDPARR